MYLADKFFGVIKKIMIIGLILLNAGFYALAQDGSLDTSFSTDGRVSTTIGTFDETAQDIVVQVDGKILVAGHSYNNMDYDFALVRYKTDGSLDTQTFGVAGVVTTPIGSADDKILCMALQSDGKIVVAGTAYMGTKDMIALARYNVDGSLDNTFNGNGFLTTSIGSNGDYPFGIAIQNDGKIVIVGGSTTSTNLDLFVARYNADGSLDPTFDGDGIALPGLSANYADLANDVKIQSDGKIVVAGYTNGGLDADFAIVRFNANGSLDNSFDNDGIFTHPIVGTFNEYANALAIQSDGKIVVVGSSNNLFYDFIITRYNPNGSLDSTFDVDGVVVTDFGVSTDFGAATDVALQNDGKILVTGYKNNATVLNIALNRYLSSGVLDNTFDLDGMVSTEFATTGDATANAISIQSDGKILVAGTNYDSKTNMAVVRYNNSSTANPTTTWNMSANELIIVPNPTNSSLSMILKNPIIQATIYIFNSLGEIVHVQNNFSGKYYSMHVENFPRGVYFVHISQPSAQGILQKLVIE